MNLHVLPETPFVQYLQTIARDKDSSSESFVWAANRVNCMLLEYALSFALYTGRAVRTPIDAQFEGLTLEREVHGIAIVRAGESLEVALRELLPRARIGKILIQRDRKTLEPQFFYEKLPPKVGDATVLLLEPMLATGGSLDLALRRLATYGVEDSQVICVNYLASPRGIDFVRNAHPECQIVVASIEEGMTEGGYMIPGIGDFGDRYFE